jgi:hypothetical protein
MPALNHRLDNMDLLIKSPTPSRNCFDEGSVSSDLSLDMLTNERDEVWDKHNGSSNNSKGWDPNGSDYSLNILLPANDGIDTSNHSNGIDTSNHSNGIDTSNHSTFSKSSLDYSLNITLPRAKKSNQSNSIDTSNHSNGIDTSNHSTFSKSSLDYSLNLTLPRAKKSSLASLKSAALPEEPETDSTDAASSASSSSSAQNEASPSTGPRQVHFYPRVRVQRVKNRGDLCSQHIADVWYSRDEFKEIRQECYDTIQILTAGDDLNEYEYEGGMELCSRGLEYKVPSLYKERQRNKSEVRSAIFEEQDFQYENSMDDPDFIANVSKELSQGCVSAAIAAALDDQLFACAYQREG